MLKEPSGGPAPCLAQCTAYWFIIQWLCPCGFGPQSELPRHRVRQSIAGMRALRIRLVEIH